MNTLGAQERKRRTAADIRELERAKRLALNAIEATRRVLAQETAPPQLIAKTARRAARETGRLWDAASRLTT